MRYQSNTTIKKVTLGPKVEYSGLKSEREFLSLDPLKDKYAAWSAYNYVLCNPVNLVDPDGRDVIIPHKGQHLKYVSGRLYTSNGSIYTGKVKGFLKQAVNALNTMGETSSGGAMLGELQSSSNVFTIRSFKENPKGRRNEFVPDDIGGAMANQLLTDPSATGKHRAHPGGSGGTIYWDPTGTDLPTLDGIQSNSITDFAHELFHGLDANRGLLDDRNENGIQREEWQAVYRENILRGEMGLPYRTYYKTERDPSGNVLGGTGPFMLDSNNKPIKPNWYESN